MSVRIQIYSEWGSYPFLLDEGDGVPWHVDPESFGERFGLPRNVLRAVVCWDEMFQSVLDRDDPGGSDWASPEQRQVYVEKGREVMLLLRAHLPADIPVEYRAEGSIAPEYF